MSSSTTTQIKPRRTIVHYKYRLLLKLGLDPYEAPENVTYNYDTWSEVCQGISTHLGQIIDKKKLMTISKTRFPDLRRCPWGGFRHGESESEVQNEK